VTWTEDWVIFTGRLGASVWLIPSRGGGGSKERDRTDRRTDMTEGSEERIYCKALTKITKIMKIDNPKAHTLRRG
jgi:hypothetical protein